MILIYLFINEIIYHHQLILFIYIKLLTKDIYKLNYILNYLYNFIPEKIYIFNFLKWQIRFTFK